MAAWAVEVHVLGGGALGASAALALAEQGHDVVLFEREALGAGMTGRAAGIVSTMTWHDDEYRLIAETRGRIGQIMSLAMMEGEPAARGLWRPAESVVVARGDGLTVLDGMQDRLERHGEEPERMDHRQATQAFPDLRFEPGEEALVAQEDGWVDAGDLMQVLGARLRGEGVEVRVGRRGVPVADGAVEGVDAFVVAGGAWTRALLGDAGVVLPLASFRTQLCALRMPAAPMVHDGVHGFYARPDGEAGMLAGDGTQLRPFDPDDHDAGADASFREHVAAGVVARFAHGGGAVYRNGWAGLCVGTPDRRPLCGPVPGIEGLHVLTGDNGFGIMRCLALGESLADAVRGTVDPGLDPARFPPGLVDFELREGYGF